MDKRKCVRTRAHTHTYTEWNFYAAVKTKKEIGVAIVAQWVKNPT